MTALFAHEAGNSTDQPTILLHGGAMSGRMWQPQADVLVKYHRLASLQQGLANQ